MFVSQSTTLGCVTQLSICTAQRVRRVWLPSNLHIFPKNRKILPLHPKRAIIFGLITTQKYSLHTSQRWNPVRLLRCTYSAAHFLHLTLPSDADVSPKEATCHSKPWGQTLNQELTSQWRFQFPVAGFTTWKSHKKFIRLQSQVLLAIRLVHVGCGSVPSGNTHRTSYLLRPFAGPERSTWKSSVFVRTSSYTRLHPRTFLQMCVDISFYAHLLCPLFQIFVSIS